MQHIRANIHHLKTRLQPYPHARIMGVTKYASLEQTQAVVDSGLLLLGENKVQDGIQKITQINNPDIEWHLIGHLQSNKVKKAVAHFSMIQSVDSLKLLTKIGEESRLLDKTMPVLLEINLGNEPNKHGFNEEDIWLNHAQLWQVNGVLIQGIMIIPPFSDNPETTRPYFKRAKKLYDHLKSVYSNISILSMGMSSDFNVALQEGSNLIRVGHLLFD